MLGHTGCVPFREDKESGEKWVGVNAVGGVRCVPVVTLLSIYADDFIRIWWSAVKVTLKISLMN